jgi:hypothetical protein
VSTQQEQPAGVTHRDFLDRALVSAGEWSRHADPKVLAVLVLLGLGAKDLVDHAARFIHPHEPPSAHCNLLISATGHSCGGIGAAVAFAAAAGLAALTVVLVTQGLFSRLRMKGLLPGDHEEGPIRSMLFFDDVARHGSQAAYAAAVLARSEQQLLADLAGQVYEVSRTAADKHRAARRAYVVVLGFLSAWATARLLLATVT